MGISLSLTPRVPHPLGHKLAARSRQQKSPTPERITIQLSIRRLGQLLRTQQLQAEDFSCADATSKECVRQLMLQSLQAGDDQPRGGGD